MPRLNITRHALERMDERGWTVKEVRLAYRKGDHRVKCQGNSVVTVLPKDASPSTTGEIAADVQNSFYGHKRRRRRPIRGRQTQLQQAESRADADADDWYDLQLEADYACDTFNVR